MLAVWLCRFQLAAVPAGASAAADRALSRGGLQPRCGAQMAAKSNYLSCHHPLAQVMEYCESDLEHVIRDRSRLLSAGDIKAYMQASAGAGACVLVRGG